MPDFEHASVVLGSELRPRARYSTGRRAGRVHTRIPIVIVEILDAIARDTRRSRSAVINDVLRAHPDIAAALTARGG